MHRKAVFTVVIAVSFSATLIAQQRSTLRGEIVAESPVRYHDLSIELRGTNGIQDKVALTMDGKFEFRDIEMGQYRLRVLTLHGDAIREEYVNVGSGYETFTIRLRAGEYSSPSNGVVSLRRLTHK